MYQLCLSTVGKFDKALAKSSNDKDGDGDNSHELRVGAFFPAI